MFEPVYDIKVDGWTAFGWWCDSNSKCLLYKLSLIAQRWPSRASNSNRKSVRWRHFSRALSVFAVQAYLAAHLEFLCPPSRCCVVSRTGHVTQILKRATFCAFLGSSFSRSCDAPIIALVRRESQVHQDHAATGQREAVASSDAYLQCWILSY